MVNYSVELNSAQVTLRDDGIIEISVRDGIDIALADAEELIATIKSFESSKLILVIHSAHSLQNDARVELLGSPYATALAFLSCSKMGTTVYETILEINPPPYPVKIFSDKSAAISWLHEQPK